MGVCYCCIQYHDGQLIAHIRLDPVHVACSVQHPMVGPTRKGGRTHGEIPSLAIIVEALCSQALLRAKLPSCTSQSLLVPQSACQTGNKQQLSAVLLLHSCRCAVCSVYVQCAPIRACGHHATSKMINNSTVWFLH